MPTTDPAKPDDIRAAGWAVAVHNDYKQDGAFHTFWLFTRGDRCAKGEGRSDAEALNLVRSAIGIDKRMAYIAANEDADGSFGGLAGPYPDVKDALAYMPHGVPNPVIVASDGEYDRVVYRWNDGSQKWVKGK